MAELARLSTGIDGLDTVLGGGLLENQNVLVRGPPGVGKTIFGLHFLAAGATGDETSLYVNLGEPTEYVERTADHFGLNPDALHFLELAPTEERFAAGETYSLFDSSEVEQPSLVGEVRETVEDLQPDRVLIDPITEFRYLTADEHQFRTQILGLLDFLREQGATVLMTSQASEELSDSDLQFLTDAVVDLAATSDTRTVTISKFRGPPVRSGAHTFDISSEGIDVWPRLEPPAHGSDVPDEQLSSGVPELDRLLGGGLERGTITFFSGPTGAGKTTTSLQFVRAAASQGTQSLVLSFEESYRTLRKRSEALNIPIHDLVEQGAVDVVEIDPDEYTVDQISNEVQSAVEDDGVELVLVDGVRGFEQNLRGLADDPTDHLVTLGRYLRRMGVTALYTNEVHNVTGEFHVTEEGTSNLADNIVFLRHVEYRGTMRKVIGVLKKRMGDFEHQLRELEFGPDGISVGEPLPELRGILTGTPEWDDTDGATDSVGD